MSPETEPLTLRDFSEIPVSRLAGVGPKAEKSLHAVEIDTVFDLLTHYPRRYLDRTKEARIADLTVGEEGSILVEIIDVSSRRTRNRRTMVNVDVSDGSGRLRLTFFNQPWRERQLQPGMQAVVFGKLDTYRGQSQMANPVVDLVGDKTNRIVPVYPQSEKAGLNTWDLAKWVEAALRRSQDRGLAEPVPAEVLARWDLVDRGVALRKIHVPDSMADVAVARRRLVFDELLRVQLELVVRKRRLEAESVGLEHVVDGPLIAAFNERLPFALTGAQQRAIDEIDRDLILPRPMHRLLQGDVGSGKTLVAVHALLVSVQGGHQGILMAPTEVLAEQHAMAVRALLDGIDVGDASNLFGGRPLRIELLTSRVTGADRRELLAGLASGEVNIAIGTHALIQEAVEFASPGVVVIDEQHRFGVEQRAALREKSPGAAVPDVLVMTATPIPRTAAMTVYGDLDVSVLDELPPGRKQIRTVWASSEESEADVWEHMVDEARAGRQGYVVCPLIEESDKLEVASAEEVFDRLSAGELSGLRLGLLHGRLTSAEKEQTMALFRSGELDVLVATTVIEVGVDVANATVMVILDADRFGMAQLHQLRGRVGRGTEESYCYLLGEATTADGQQRLEAMVDTTDGFELAEIDLDIRGEGTIMGERQKGRNDLKLASLRRDREWVGRAREVAFEIVDADPDLTEHQLLADEVALALRDDETDFLLKG